MDSQSGSMFVHSVVSDVVIMLLQAVAFHLILILYESKSHKKLKVVEVQETDNEPPEDEGSIPDGEEDENKEAEIPEEILINNPVQG